MAPRIGEAVAEAATRRRWADLWKAEFLRSFVRTDSEDERKDVLDR